MNWLVTGAGGILGSAFVKVLGAETVETAGRADLNIANPDAIRQLVNRVQPNVIINCAAHTDVDGAQDTPEIAYAANYVLPELLAWSCRKSGILLVHISSTGCYGNWNDNPYSEWDKVTPLSIHHKSKVAGEKAVIASGCDHLIIRTGWLFGGAPGQPKNFVWKRLIEASQQPEMFSDASQTGNPTFVGDVADQVLHLCDLQLRGVFNVVSQGSATRFDYVREITKISRIECSVRPTLAFRRRAPVSHNEAALNVKMNILGCNRMPLWQSSLSKYVSSVWPPG